MKIENQTRETVLMSTGRRADTFWLRLKGLLGSPPLKQGEGLLLVNEKSIHTLFMGFAIDVVYIDQANKVIKLTHAMPPWRLGPFVSQSAGIIELPPGVIDATNTTVGDQLILSA